MQASETPTPRLLLCSSDTRKLDPLCRRFRASGMDVDVATEADEVRQLMWEQHYDGVAVDLLLADRDGISFALELRQEHPWVSIIVISSTARPRHDDTGPDWLQRSGDYARLVFALKQAGQRAAGQAPSILHLEDDDRIAELVQNTVGRQLTLFRARSAKEAQIAMSLRNYDLALMGCPSPSAETPARGRHSGQAPAPLWIDTDPLNDPFLLILDNLRQRPFVHEAAYC